ncbi:septum formation initiator family protein [Lactobacillus mulieris]|nr:MULTISPECIES: septum formation initiator family protein [Lactobacillus]TRT37919.1 septum formation initiator family protein [Lactobacillus sp. c10Ua232AE]TRT41024.1 septum formation initiator family protein [Lactobacillus mulieris]
MRGPRIYEASDKELAQLRRKRKKATEEVHRKRRVRYLTIFGLIFVVLGIQLILNITTTHRIKSEIQTNKTSLVEQKETNRRLKIKRNNLKDPDYLAKYIRYKFYYSKKGEQIYNIP